MNRIEDKEKLRPPTNQATLCFLINDEKVLLGKKREDLQKGNGMVLGEKGMMARQFGTLQ